MNQEEIQNQVKASEDVQEGMQNQAKGSEDVQEETPNQAKASEGVQEGVLEWILEKALMENLLPVKEAVKDLNPQDAQTIFDAVSYSVLLGGKRLRPMLLLLTCEALGGQIQEALPFACAVEYIHTYSLIHDDLPDMDNDDFRRGKPTNHKIFGTAMAILAGDGLLNLAMETLFDASTSPQRLKAAQSLSHASGLLGMVVGQCVDILSTNKLIDNDTLLYIHRHKTGALIEASMTAGAYLSGAPADTCQQIKEIGKNIGLVFQIMDDYMDVYGDAETTGKGIHRDIESNKNTYITAFGSEQAVADIKRYSSLALEALAQLKLQDTRLFEMIKRRFTFESVFGNTYQ